MQCPRSLDPAAFGTDTDLHAAAGSVRTPAHMLSSAMASQNSSTGLETLPRTLESGECVLAAAGLGADSLCGSKKQQIGMSCWRRQS